MSKYEVDATDRSPKVLIDPDAGIVTFEGESYPENVVEFFGPILEQLRSFLKASEGRAITATFKLRYFNSSSAKVIFNIIDTLDGAGKDNDLAIQWFADAEDDVMIEFGEDLQDDVTYAKFEILTDS